MKRFARLDNNRVAEILEKDWIDGKFHPSLVFEEVSPEVVVGMIKTSSGFAHPENEEPSVELIRHQRSMTYISEADPLFFKAQRGEATMEEWQAKVAEIKARFPK